MILCLEEFQFELKVVQQYSCLWETHHRATECHLPYGITQCYLPLDTGEHALPYPQPDSLVLDLSTQRLS